MFKKIKKLWDIIKYYFKDEDNLLLHLMELKAQEILNSCYELNVGKTEDIENLIFHIRSYYDILENSFSIYYPELKNINISKVIKMYRKNKLNVSNISKFVDFLEDVEKQRAVERDIIFEYAKVLSFGFKL